MNTRYIHTNHSAFLLTSGHDIHPAPERIPNQQRKTILPSLVILVGIIFVTSLLIFSGYASAWSDDSTVNTPICTAASDQECPQIINDGSGGAIITWADYRSGSTGTKRDIYAQRVDASGTPQWTTDGVAICTESGDQNHPAITSDGSGGAIITWADYRSGTNWDIYAQRVDASGSVQWTSDVPICTADYTQYKPQITSDGSGGAIITWEDWRIPPYYDIYAQRVDATGNIPASWTTDGTDGVAICKRDYHQRDPQITSDGSGGAIITWWDYRSTTEYDIYAQRVDATGNIPASWTTDGVAICTEIQDQTFPMLTSDGSGGAIIIWLDYSSTSNYDIYAQRVDASGSVQWTSDVPICTAGNYQGEATLTSDGSGGAIITWVDSRTGTNNDIYAQRVDATGNIPSSWTTDGTDGVPICTADDDQEFPQIINDGSGGAIITWDDCRGGITNSDIYAQLVNASGVPQWNANGVAICTADYDQRDLQITTDGSGGAIITWSDYRSSTDTDYDIYAQQIYKSGKLSKDFPWILFYPAILKKQ